MVTLRPKLPWTRRASHYSMRTAAESVPCLPYGESPMNVSVVAFPVLRSRGVTVVILWVRITHLRLLCESPFGPPELRSRSLIDSSSCLRQVTQGPFTISIRVNECLREYAN